MSEVQTVDVVAAGTIELRCRATCPFRVLCETAAEPLAIPPPTPSAPDSHGRPLISATIMFISAGCGTDGHTKEESQHDCTSLARACQA